MVLSGLGLLLLQLTAAAQGQPPAQAHIKAALRHYANLDYETALNQLHSAQLLARSDDETVSILLYEGIIFAEMNEKEESAAAFAGALRLRPAASLPVKVAPKIQQQFEAVRAARQEPLITPPAQEKDQAPKKPAKATIVLTRQRGRWNTNFAVEVVINNEKAGEIREGTTQKLVVDPGDKEIYVRLGAVRSHALSLVLAPGEEAAVVCMEHELAEGADFILKKSEIPDRAPPVTAEAAPSTDPSLNGQAVIVLMRERGRQYTNMVLDVIVNGSEKSKLSEGAVDKLFVEPKPTEIYVKHGATRSNKVSLDLVAGQQIKLICTEAEFNGGADLLLHAP